ncbi:double-strand break repair protein AddB [Albimonas sp. CAU 1670]|uniref:double-strand break repair protein AddB n=1 Tax=Albimonas sp. CAU 1670 TaxID=3032599 RepID=UPI0023DAE9A1|nr:double-strand break repair protein AddB [Albimonas sp. CAU 1670]MDF2232497.1 double-strand break repair protein AddB [Albimonas sp. CAU 1670]
MKLFAAPDPGAAAAPRVFHVPPGADFSAALARGLRARLAAAPGGDAPEAMARVQLYLNTRRTGRAVFAALEAGRPAAWLPRVSYVGELAEEATLAGIPAGSGPLRRTLALMRLTEAFLGANPEFGDPVSAPALAMSLRALLDELQAAGREAQDLRELDLEQHARHWELTARFLAIAAEHWPAWLEENEHGAPDPETRRRLAVAALAARWAASPPGHPVIAAGSTASTPATAELLAAVARLPDGAVVLPGWDPEIPSDVWEELTGDAPRPEHPHHFQARFLAGLGLGPADVAPWDEGEPPSRARLRLLTQALRPAPVTDHWLEALEDLSAEAPEATAGLALLEAETPRDEAAAIAGALMAEAAAGRTAALVTPDQVLARRVKAELARWEIEPDDSAGRPLGLTPPGILLGLAAGRLGRPMTAEALAALLRHPLTAAPARRAHLRCLAFLVREALRGGPREIDWDRMQARLDARRADPERPAQAPEGFDAWLSWLRALLEPLADAPAGAAGLAAIHRAAAEALSLGPDPLPQDPGAAPETDAEGVPLAPLWSDSDGRDALRFVERLAEAAPAHGDGLAAAAYGALWTALIRAEQSRPRPERVTERIRILGALEARAETAQLMILGGLNEGAWPAHPSPDPWLNRGMREQLGLASPERRIGLSAHDFLIAANAPRAILSRSKRDDGGPSNPARWLVRLQNLLEGASDESLKAMRARGRALLRGADALDDATKLPAEERPNPRPPLDVRPRRLSVTAVETLVRDPYAIYARHVLKLKKLEPLGRAPDARDMGVALHAVMEAFARDVSARPELRREGLHAALMAAAERVLPDLVPWPAQRRLWLKRLARVAGWFVEGELVRRAEGEVAALEAKGRRTLATGAGEFLLTATADRIDRKREGGLAIYDYKTGAPPSVKQIGVYNVQLQLEAAMAEAGGFPDVPPAPVTHLEYLGLSGTSAGGTSRPVDLVKHPADRAWAQLAELIARYDDPGQGYRSRERLPREEFVGDYDQLARHGEWSGAEDEE